MSIASSKINYARMRDVLRELRETYVAPDPLLTRGVLIFALTQIATIGWDVPCMYGWENDGVAPRDLFGGLAFNLTPGNGHRYPLFHYLLLALLAWPVVLLGILGAPSMRVADLMPRVLSVPVLTGIALIAKLLSVAMGCVTLLVLARVARRTLSASASRWATCFAALNLSFAYYARVTNVDGPYLMWVMLSLDRMLDVFERGESRDYRGFALYAALALATKDQAYAVYAITLPVYFVLLPWARPDALPIERSLHVRRLGYAALVATVSYGLASAAFLNPPGFVHRFHLLTGTNSQDWRRYEHGWQGLWANIQDLARSQAEFFWPWPVLAVAWIWVLVVLLQPTAAGLRSRWIRLLPLMFALSSIATFTLVAARCEHRFVLPLGLALSYYAGAALTDLNRYLSRPLRYALIALLIVPAAGRSLSLHLTQWCDARRQVEHWLAKLPLGSRVETYGLGVYLPRFDRSAGSPYRVQRVAPDTAPAKRPPIPGMLEIQDAYGHVSARAPDVLVVTEGFATRFLPSEHEVGHLPAPETIDPEPFRDPREFFSAALHDRLPGYRIMFVAEARLPRIAERLGLTPIHIHGSTAAITWVLANERLQKLNDL